MVQFFLPLYSYPSIFVDNDLFGVNFQYNRESDQLDLDLDHQDGTSEHRPSTAMEAGGMFEGICEFCGQNIKPFPTLEDQKSRSPQELYCCDEYSEFIQFMITHPLHEQYNADKMIDIAPHPPHGSKQARRAAKERAAQRYLYTSISTLYFDKSFEIMFAYNCHIRFHIKSSYIRFSFRYFCQS